MPNHPLSCEECHRRKQKCNRQTPCQHCIGRGKQESCRPHQVHVRSSSRNVLERLKTVEEELNRQKIALEELRQERKGERIDEEESEVEGEVNEQTYSLGGQMEKRQVGSLFEQMQQSNRQQTHSPQREEDTIASQLDLPINLQLDLVDEQNPLAHPDQASDIALQLHGVPASCLSDLLTVLPTRQKCDALVSHFYNDINWIRQPWPRKSLCQSFAHFWESGPTLTTQNLNTFALLCGLCAISRLSIQHPDFTNNVKMKKWEARRLHYTSRHSLMLGSVFHREDLDQIIAWTLVCRLLVLEQRYGEAYTCAARTVKAAYSINLHRDGTNLGFNEQVTESRRKVWSAVYYFDRTISMMTGKPPVIDDRYCDVCPPSETESIIHDIYPVSEELLGSRGQGRVPTPYAYCVHRHKISVLQGRMVTCFLSLRGSLSGKKQRDKELASIDLELEKVTSTLPGYLQVQLEEPPVSSSSSSSSAGSPLVGIHCDKSWDEPFGFLPIQRFLLQSELNALCIALHRPFLLSKEQQHEKSVRACLNAALLDIGLYKDFLTTTTQATVSPWQVDLYIGTHRWFHSVLICGIVLLAQPRIHDSQRLLRILENFVDRDEQEEEQSSSLSRQIEIVNYFIKGYQSRSGDKSKRSATGTGRSSKKQRIDTEDSRTPSSQTHSNYQQGDKVNVDAQQLLDSWYSRGDPHFLQNQTPASAYRSETSQVFGAEPSVKPLDPSQVLLAAQAQQQQNNSHNMPPSTYDAIFSFQQQESTPSFFDYAQSANNYETINADFWMSLIDKL